MTATGSLLLVPEFVGTLFLIIGVAYFQFYVQFAAKWLAGLKAIRPPSPFEVEAFNLTAAEGEVATGNAKQRRKKQKKQMPTEFPALEQVLLTKADVQRLPYFRDFDTLFFFSLLGAAIFVFIDVWDCFRLQTAKISFVQTLLLIVAFSNLVGAARTLFAAGLCSYETLIGCCSGVASSTLAYVLLVYTDDHTFWDLELPTYHASMLTQLNAFIVKKELQLPQDVAFGLVWTKVFLAAVGGFMGIVFFFATMRRVRYFNLAVSAKNQQELTVEKLLHYVSFFMPLLLALMWIKPLVKDNLPQLSQHDFESMRLGLVFCACTLRLLMFRRNMQTHLDQGLLLVGEFGNAANSMLLSSETTQANSSDVYRLMYSLRIQLSNVWAILPHTAVQYLSPPFYALFLSMLLKWKAGASLGVCGVFVEQPSALIQTPSVDTTAIATPLLSFMLFWYFAITFLQSIVCLSYLRYTSK